MEEKKELTTEKSEKTSGYKVGSLSPSILSAVQLAQMNIDSVVKANAALTSPVVDAILKQTSMISSYTSPLVERVLKETTMLSAMSSTLTKLALNYTSNLTVLSNAVQSMLGVFGKIDYSPLWNIQSLLQGFDFSKYRKELDNIYLQELTKAKWFPVHISMVNAGFFADIMNVIDTTKPDSKSRVNKLNKVFFTYYDEKNLNELKKYWKTHNIPSHIKRILYDAIQAYKRKQYALTISALAPLWQGIIQEKAKGLQEGKTNNKTKQEFQALITENDCNSFVQYYFEEYVFYTCYSLEEVKDDVPGRNSICHSWYNKYPSRKTALNAIIFTDFLLELEPIKKENTNG